ncbi:MAG: response regulator transcription factor [Candidatus Zixiibacteriota bacterium]
MAAPRRILVVEDEKDIGDLVVHYLQREGFTAYRVGDGRTALARAEKEKPDLIILDLMLPGIDGLEITRRLRQAEGTMLIPIIMLTAKAEESDKVIGLEMGADDYLTKPFSPRELLARVRSMLRRLERGEKAPSSYQYGPLQIDRARFELKVDGTPIALTAKEFGLLEAFLRARGRVLTREFLLNTVWGYDYYGSTRTVDVHVRHLREKIPLLAAAIVTVKNIGYKLRDEL